jgi:hypothetical protein
MLLLASFGLHQTCSSLSDSTQLRDSGQYCWLITRHGKDCAGVRVLGSEKLDGTTSISSETRSAGRSAVEGGMFRVFVQNELVRR